MTIPDDYKGYDEYHQFDDYDRKGIATAPGSFSNSLDNSSNAGKGRGDSDVNVGFMNDGFSPFFESKKIAKRDTDGTVAKRVHKRIVKRNAQDEQAQPRHSGSRLNLAGSFYCDSSVPGRSQWMTVKRPVSAKGPLSELK